MSTDTRSAFSTAEDVQALDNALEDVGSPPLARRALLRRAGIGLLAASGGSTLLAACGGGSEASGSTKTTTMGSASAPSSSSSTNSATDIINTAVTAEALAVTYVTAVVKKAPGTPVAKYTKVLQAVNAAEYDHYKALKKLGAKPLTEKFWVPSDFFGSNLSGVFTTLQLAEKLFVDAYLIATTTFANAGKSDLARYAGEIGTVEAQHLMLANLGAGQSPPNDIAFEEYPITNIHDVVTKLQSFGVGFGKQGSKPGGFATFAPPPAGATTHIKSNTPS